MCTGFVTVTACKYLMPGKCLHVLDLPDEAEEGSLTPHWFRLCLLWTGCIKHLYMISAGTSLKCLCADTPFFLLIVGAGRSRVILIVVLVGTKAFFCLILCFLVKGALISVGDFKFFTSSYLDVCGCRYEDSQDSFVKLPQSSAFGSLIF